MNNISVNAIFQVGMWASDVLEKIAEINQRISSLYFYTYRPTHNLKEEGRCNLIPISRLLQHDPSTKRLKLKRGEITGNKILSMIGLLEKDYVLAVLSEVWTGKKRLHIPMIDFDSNEKGDNLAKIECFLRAIGQQGVVLDSGRAYHFYGIKLMNEKQWVDFLGDCLLYDLVEPRYLGHRLKDGVGILRISACALRPKVPSVVSIISKEIPKARAIAIRH